MKKNENKLAFWQERLQRNQNAYASELEKMQRRERQYAGDRKIRSLVEAESEMDMEATHVYNITAENIEAEIDNNIMMPKVTPIREEDEPLARLIEEMLRAELDRMTTEELNDEAERIVKKQGGVIYLSEWDTALRTHSTTGANVLQALHPQKLIPQDGVDRIEDMDYFFLRIPMTKNEVNRRYGVIVDNASEDAQEIRGLDVSTAEDMVTVYMAYYKNDNGGIGRYVWVGDQECEDLEDCQSRVIRRCRKCGMTETDSQYTVDTPVGQAGETPRDQPRRRRKDECAFCHSRSWEKRIEMVREVPADDLDRLGVPERVKQRLLADAGYGDVLWQPYEDLTLGGAMPMDGGLGAAPAVGGMNGGLPDAMGGLPGIGAEAAGMNGGPAGIGAEGLTGMMQGAGRMEGMRADEAAYGVRVQIPYYAPNLYPVVLQKNITAYGSFLGESDCDKLMDHQNTMNRLSKKVNDKLLKAGSAIVTPPDARLTINPEDSRIWNATNLTDLGLIQKYDFEGDISQCRVWMLEVYEQSRRMIGITDSYQGRKDSSAESGKAKEFAAAQTAGRLWSKRVLKEAAWAKLFERMFKQMLAYADESRDLRMRDANGQTRYEQWHSYAFLDVDAAGEIYWNDQFIFSCDTASGLAADREGLWKERTSQLQSGAFGDPTQIGTLIIYWTMMEGLHYPGASEIKRLLEDRQREEMQQQALMMQMQQAAQTGAAVQGQAGTAGAVPGGAPAQAAPAMGQMSALPMNQR